MSAIPLDRPPLPATLEPPWFIEPRAAGAAVRLFCLPWAGGGAAPFVGWATRVDPAISVCPACLPGREGRLREPVETNWPRLVLRLAAGLERALDRPFALFGHSMGALLAWELALHLRRERLPAPIALIVSAHRTPAASAVAAGPRLSGLDDDSLVAMMRDRYDAIPEAVAADRALLRVVLPTLRGDLTLLETYRPTESPPLAVPILALGGLRDPAARRDELASWRSLTSSGFEVRMFPGNHFYFRAADGMVLPVIGRFILSALASAEAGRFR